MENAHTGYGKNTGVFSHQPLARGPDYVCIKRS